MVGTLPKLVLIFITYPVIAYCLTYYIPWWQALILWNVSLGFTYVNIAWSLVPRYLTPNEERDSLFPAFRRLDSQHWRKWMFIPGAVTLFPIRMIISLGSLFWLVVWLRIVMIGHKWGKVPLTGWRLWANETGYKVASWIIISTSFMTMKKHEVQYDYSEYLGNDYLQKQTLPLKTSTIVSNHMAWLDSLILIYNVYPGFAAKIETKKVPILNDLIDNLQSIYISRGGTEAQRTDNLNEIIQRQKQVESDPRFPPICVYPEGTQTNGTALLSFKKGAFAGLNTVQPVVMKYKWTYLSPTWEGMPFVAHAALMYCYGTFHVDVYVLPPFKPNDYLFTKYQEQGKEQWEIFAWAIREVMSKFGNFQKATQTNSEKIMYKNFMVGKTDELQYQGKTWTAPTMHTKLKESKTKKSE